MVDVELQTREVWTWRVMAALAAVTPVSRTIETHPGGGQYDCVEAFIGGRPEADGLNLRVALNRAGSLHVLHGGPDFDSRGIWEALARGLPLADVVEWVLGKARLARTPKVDAMSRSLAAMAEMVGHAVGCDFDRSRRWEWRNGQLDTSGGEGGRWDAFFDAVPAAARACTPRRDDLFGVAEYRFWFLLADGKPLFAVEPSTATLFFEGDSFAVDGEDGRACWWRVVTGALPRPPKETRQRWAEARRPEFRRSVRRLVDQVAPTVTPFEPGPAMTEHAVWLNDDAEGLLVVAVGADEPPLVMDKVLAFALAWQGDRDLVLIVPEYRAGKLLERLPWVATPVRVFTYWHDWVCRPAVVPSRAEVLAAAASSRRPVRPTGAVTLGDRADWVEALSLWATNDDRLDSSHRNSYMSWQCAGQQVLRIGRTKNGLRIQAGSQSKLIDAPWDRHVETSLDAANALVQIQINVEAGAMASLASGNLALPEHRMQAALARTTPVPLGLIKLEKEYPAWRADGRSGSLDFLGLGADNRLHVVETKVGWNDVAVIFQALDYATWVEANAEKIREKLHWPLSPGTEKVVIDFVFAPKGTRKAIGPYTAGQLEALAGDVDWRVTVIADPLAYVPEVAWGPAQRTFPEPGPWADKPVRPARWAAQIATGLQGKH